MKSRLIRKSEVVGGREVEYVAELLMTREELARLTGDPDVTEPLSSVDRLKVSRLLDEIDASARDFTAQGTLSDVGKRRYANVEV